MPDADPFAAADMQDSGAAAPAGAAGAMALGQVRRRELTPEQRHYLASWDLGT